MRWKGQERSKSIIVGGWNQARIASGAAHGTIPRSHRRLPNGTHQTKIDGRPRDPYGTMHRGGDSTVSVPGVVSGLVTGM
jgi:hypothetical protein